MSDYYNNKTVFITGGSSGIGLAIANALAARGANIAILARNRQKLDEACTVIASHCLDSGQKVQGYTLDVDLLDSIGQQVQPALTDFGSPDVLVTSAGVAIAKSFAEHTTADLRYNIDTNLLGTMGFVHALLPVMQAGGGGHIVLIGSLGGLVPTWGYSAYCTSKTALVGFAGVLQQELEPGGFKVSLVCPPEVDTPMIAAETPTIPRQTRFMKDLVGTSSPEAVAQSTLVGVARGKHLIIHSFRGRVVYLSQRLFPGLFRIFVGLLLGGIGKDRHPDGRAHDQE